jgi:2-C-methyl-D-erythritol 4-phosphate cytidylyltransferase
LNLKRYVIIVAGGVGKRMKSETPKQFMPLAGKPLLFHSITAFYNCYNDIDIIIPLPKEYFGEWEKICRENNFSIKHRLAEGGEHRFYSVKNSLSLIKDNENAVVGIHDAARPFIKKETIAELYKAAEETGNAIPVIAINDSVREINKLSSKPIDRHNLCLVQTPQCFRTDIIKRAYQQEFKLYFTDDATVAESVDEKINLIDGDPVNIKITTPTDMLIAETLFKFKV